MTTTSNDCGALRLALGICLPALLLAPSAHLVAATEGAVPDFSGSYLHRHSKASRGGEGNNLNEARPTDEAQALMDAYDPADDFAIQCEANGLKRQIIHPYPMKITQIEDSVTFNYEGWEAERIVHIGGQFPDDLETSKLGYSVGHFDGNELIIETRGMKWGYINEVSGLQFSEDAVFTEIYTRYADPEDNHIELRLTIDDPRRFEEPLLISDAWTWDPTAELLEYKCIIPESHGLGR